MITFLISAGHVLLTVLAYAIIAVVVTFLAAVLTFDPDAPFWQSFVGVLCMEAFAALLFGLFYLVTWAFHFVGVE